VLIVGFSWGTAWVACEWIGCRSRSRMRDEVFYLYCKRFEP
jgi:hypothetical protein